MARLNVAAPAAVVRNHEGVIAKDPGPEQSLYRLVSTCMLWEDSFYVDGKTVAQQIADLVPKCRPEFVAAVAYHARTHLNLRHAPLLVVREMVRHEKFKPIVAPLLRDVIQRPDEITEFMAIYWGGATRSSPIARQVKLGLGAAFNKFSEHQLAKWDNKEPGTIRLRDVMFMVHPKPLDGKAGRNAAWRREHLKDDRALTLSGKEVLFNTLAQDDLPTANTWEAQLSAGADKKATFEGMMLDGSLGALAFLRNLRNMKEAGVDKDIIRAYSEKVDITRVLPYRFISAARAVPTYEDILEPMMFRAVAGMPKLPGKTAVLLDISPSMNNSLSEPPKAAARRAAMLRAGKSVLPAMTRRDAALGLGILCRELCEEADFYAVSNDCVQAAPRRGFALGDALYAATPSNGTKLGYAVSKINLLDYDRVIMLTDEESQDPVPKSKAGKAYMINVATGVYGVGFHNWVSISGFSEAVLAWVLAFEQGTQG